MVRWGRLFLARATLLVLFSEGAGKQGHGKKPPISPKPHGRVEIPQSAAGPGARMLPPQNAHAQASPARAHAPVCSHCSY